MPGAAAEEFAVAPHGHLGDSAAFTLASSRIPCAPPAFTKPGRSRSWRAPSKNKDTHMSDQTTSGEPSTAPAETAAGAAIPVAPAGNPAPIGAFGTARGSGLSRGKRPTPAAAPAAAPASNVGYKPTAVEVVTHPREYQNPFASETPATAPVNEPAPEPAASQPTALSPEPPATVAPAPVEAFRAEPAIATKAPATEELFPLVGEPAPTSRPPQPEPSDEVPAKAEIKILPPEEAKRPAVSWGDAPHEEDSRPRRDERPSFRPDRREPRSSEPREPREPRTFEPREPRREPVLEQRGPLPRDARPAAPAQKSGGFVAWLKGLFGAKPAAPQTAQPTQRDGENRDGEFRHHRRRHRGGRGRGNYQGDNRGPRDGQPRDQQSGGQGYQGGEPRPYQQDGERRFEGGGRRRRGGRGRYRDDRGGPRSEGQQGGGAI